MGAGTLLVLALGATAGGCLNRPIDRLEPRTTSTVVERLTQSSVDKIDLLLGIDNSISMADKQAILAAAVPDLVSRLVQPICVDEMGAPQPGMPTPTVDPVTDECTAPYKPQFPPIKDINIGIVSSSLGALTANQCDGSGMADPTDNDKGRLLSRTTMGTATTYQGKGFLAWDPAGTRPTGPGESNATNLATVLTDMVVGVGQVGCGYEMQLESVYRFLADPDPYDTLAPAGAYLQEMGTDQVVMQQRIDFLRANSLLAVIILTDENDCSVDVAGQGFLVLNSAPFYRATDECAADPNNECCTSCALPNPEGCPADTSCGAQGGTGANKYMQTEDHQNLRCFEQKRRYGVDFLYPVQRYINAFTRVKIDPARRDLSVEDEDKAVTNPIFSDLSGAGVAVRDPGLVFIAGIVGVPWQAIARRCPAGQMCDAGAAPDLTYGFKTFNELAQEEAFDQLIGDPDNHVPPTDPFMIESIAKRSGMSNLTGASLPGSNPINGNDRNISGGQDLQYTCIFDLPMDQPNGPDCGTECEMDPMCDDPLCDPADKSNQINAKAYPGLRELALLRGMQDQGIFASICPQQLDDANAENYGYRPAVATIIDRLKQELGGQCLPRKLTPDKDGNVPCLVLEATKVEGGCTCDGSKGRAEIPKTIDGQANPQYNAIKAAEEDEFNPGWNCFCEIQQLQGDEKNQCQQEDPAPQDIHGWCYVDSTTVPPTGNPALVANCPPDEKRLVRFVNDGLPQPGATVFITCTGE
jgi:hypothetical protein